MIPSPCSCLPLSRMAHISSNPLSEDEMPRFDRLRNIRNSVVPSIGLQAVPESVKAKAVTTAGQARGLWGKAVSLSKGKARGIAGLRYLTETHVSPDVFDLEGDSHTITGDRAEDGSSEESLDVQLNSGVLVGYFRHSREGEFTLTLLRGDGGFEVLGNGSGEGDWIGAWQVSSRPGIAVPRIEWSQFRPDKYRLKVEASGPWSCRLIQPALNQSRSGIPYRCEGPAGGQVAGPFQVGSRPLLVSARHDGGGSFLGRLLSLDGTVEHDVVKAEGQTSLEDYPTEAMPGKEYLLFVSADGTWELEFTEGY